MNTHDALHAVLEGEVPDAARALHADDQTALAALISQSRQRQQRQLREALEDALGYVPGILRRTVRKVLFPQ